MSNPRNFHHLNSAVGVSSPPIKGPTEYPHLKGLTEELSSGREGRGQQKGIILSVFILIFTRYVHKKKRHDFKVYMLKGRVWVLPTWFCQFYILLEILIYKLF